MTKSKTTMFADREAWLTEAANLILDDILMPLVEASEKYNYDRPNFRVSVGFPKHSRSGKSIAVCFKKAASSTGVNEIFINPEIDDAALVLSCVVHELIHAYDDCASGHRNFFAFLARKAGLEGKLTATFAGEGLMSFITKYIELLGEFPHNKMNVGKTHKKDGTRQLKVLCNDCGFTFRTSMKWLIQIPADAACPVCSEQSLNITV
jgi:hypothetical protein